MKIEIKSIWMVIGFITTLCINVATGAWIASAHNTEYSDRLSTLEKNTNDLSDVRVRLSRIEGKMDVLLNNVLKGHDAGI